MESRSATRPAAPSQSWTVELYGYPRLLAARKAVTIDLPADQPATATVVLAGLAALCPALVGPVVEAGGSRLVDGYVLNRNGRSFIADLTQPLAPGDVLLLLASQVGG
ncbi:MAG: MoaD/ThiS family protein [Chloroflexi bacterium]|nr:MoaD/ThiS family protein [Chloroflexota bacterium]